MNTLDRYIARHFLNGIFIVLAILVPLFGFLMLAEELEDVGKGAFTTFDALVAVSYSLPKVILDLSPVAVLLGVLIGLGALANHRELIVINGFGYSAWRTSRPVVVTVLMIIVGITLAQFFAMPQLELKAAQLRSKAAPQTSIVGDDSEFWTRSGRQFVRIGEITGHGSSMLNIEIFSMDEQGALQELVEAATADVLSNEEWLLEDVYTTDFSAEQVHREHSERQRWKSFLSSRQTEALVVPVAAMAPSDLYRYIGMLQQNDLDTHRFRLIFWQNLSIPIALLAMSLLGLPFLIGSVRSTPIGQRAALGGCVGILFYLSEQMMGHLATLYKLPPVPASMAPDLLLLLLALMLLRRVD